MSKELTSLSPNSDINPESLIPKSQTPKWEMQNLDQSLPSRQQKQRNRVVHTTSPT